MQPEIVRMICSIGNRIRTWILSPDSDSAHMTINICRWKSENRIVIWKLRFSRNCKQNSEKSEIPKVPEKKNLGRKNGFKNNYIIQARKLGTSSQQYKKIDNLNMLRESLVVLSK